MSVNLQKAEFVRSAAKAGDFPRDRLPQVAFAGRSNVGKSSVINRLLNRKNFARVGAAPGKTTHINYFLIDGAFYLVDLPGYGYAKVSQAEKARWGRLMEEWFADNSLMTLGLMIVDARHKPTADDCTMAQWYRGAGCPFLVVANKLDKLKKSEVEGNLQRIRETLELGEEDISGLLKQVLYEFPLKELDLFLPPWVDALPQEHPIKAALYGAIRQGAGQLHRIRDVDGAIGAMRECEQVSQARVTNIDLGTGLAAAVLELPRALFYDTLSQQSGFQIGDDGDLMALLTQLAQVKAEYDKVADALKEVEETGYGIVVPSIDSLVLEEPEIVRQGGRYGVRLKASAPSIHMIRADIETEVSPIVGSEKQSEEMIHYLLQEFEGDTAKIWQSNIFGKSFHELVGEDLNAKVKRMPEDAREKLRETLQRIINEGSGGLICIIL